jgi:uncharacterized OsmC-like protein
LRVAREDVVANSTVRDAIEKLSRLLAQQPEKARAKSPPATAVLEDGLKVQVTGEHGERVSTDMSPALGGSGAAPNPGWLLRAAMASCHATVIAMRAAHTGVALTSLEVTVSSEADVRGMLGTEAGVSAGLSGLRTHVKIGAQNATPDQLREIVQWADEHSPVGCTVRQSPTNAVEIEVLSRS